MIAKITEMYGHHFYIGMVQYKCLMDGIRYFGSLGDTLGVKRYRAEAEKLSKFLEKYSSNEKMLIIPTHSSASGHGTKINDLDFSIVMLVS